MGRARPADALALPVTPAEVWGAGVTYQRSADFREEGTGIYDRVYAAPRPELFFKATAARCVAHGQAIGRRRDSSFTASEPEMAIVVGASGTILGYTLANDVSAWDIERDNPLYLPQSKVLRGLLRVRPRRRHGGRDRRPAVRSTLHCSVDRGGREVFAGSASTAQLKRPLGGARRLAPPLEPDPGRDRALDRHRHHPADGRRAGGRRRRLHLLPRDRHADEPRRLGLNGFSAS